MMMAMMMAMMIAMMMAMKVMMEAINCVKREVAVSVSGGLGKAGG